MICCITVIIICLISCVLGVLGAVIQGIIEGLRDGIEEIGSQMVDEAFDNHKKKKRNQKK